MPRDAVSRTANVGTVCSYLSSRLIIERIRHYIMTLLIIILMISNVILNVISNTYHNDITFNNKQIIVSIMILLIIIAARHCSRN